MAKQKELTQEVIDTLKNGSYLDRYKFNPKDYGMVEKKGQFDYISWSYCELLGNLIDPDFSWDQIGLDNEKGIVEVFMSFEGRERTLNHPILDFSNKPITNPTSFDINKGQMRGMSKLFSIMTGIGLSLYTGEDLPEENTGAHKGPYVETKPAGPRPAVQLISDKQLKYLNTLISEAKVNRNELKKQLGVKSLKDLNINTASGLIEKLKTKLESPIVEPH